MSHARLVPIVIVAGLFVTPGVGDAENEVGCKTLYDSYNYVEPSGMRRDAHGEDAGWGITIIGFANQSHPHTHRNGLDTFTLDHTWGWFGAGHDVCI